MLFPIKLICDCRARRDATNAVCDQYCFRPDKRTILKTGIFIPLIASKVNKVCADRQLIYRNIKEHLKAFEVHRKKGITFDCLDLNFYEEFVDFLTYDYVQRRKTELKIGLKTNTIGKTINQLRTFLRNRIRKKLFR